MRVVCRPTKGTVIPKTPNDPLCNQLLAALPEAEFKRWLRLLEPVDLALGQVL